MDSLHYEASTVGRTHYFVAYKRKKFPPTAFNSDTQSAAFAHERCSKTGTGSRGNVLLLGRHTAVARSEHTRSSDPRPSLDEGMINFSNRAHARLHVHLFPRVCPTRFTHTQYASIATGDGDGETSAPLVVPRGHFFFRETYGSVAATTWSIIRRFSAIKPRDFVEIFRFDRLTRQRASERARGYESTVFSRPAVLCRKRDLSPLDSPFARGRCLEIYFALL